MGLKITGASISKSFISASVIAFIFYLFTSGIISFNSFMIGFALSIIGIFILTIFILYLNLNGNDLTITYIFKNVGPLLILITLLFLILYLTHINRHKIINNNLGVYYYSFSNIIVFLYFIQIYYIFTGITINVFDKNKPPTNKTNGIIYLINLLIFMCYLAQYIILMYFTTDG